MPKAAPLGNDEPRLPRADSRLTEKDMADDFTRRTEALVANRPAGLPAMAQRWDDLLFLHWRADPAELSRRLPGGLSLDTFGGEAHIGLVAFAMRRVRPWLLPPLPWLSDFLELNVRLYVRGPDGTPGVHFLSLDCERDLAVRIARAAFHLPYRHATMACRKASGAFRYTCRRGGEGATAHLAWKPHGSVAPAAAGTLEHFLAERYAFFTKDTNGHLLRGEVRHAPYGISPAGLAIWDDQPLRWDGLGALGAPSHSMASPGVSVRCWSLRPA